MDIGIKQIVIIRLMETKNFLPSKISLPGIMTSFPVYPMIFLNFEKEALGSSIWVSMQRK